MRNRSVFVTAIIFSAFAVVAYSQGELPQGRQPPRPGAVPRTDVPPPGATAPADPAYMQQVSYALGRNFATNLKDNEINCDLPALIAGINDVLTGAQPKWTDEQLEAVLQRFGQEMQQKAMTRMQRQAAKNQQEAAAFLAQNGNREGVQTTPSGLQYRVIQEGNGASPTPNDRVKCNYKGTLLNGTVFDASEKHGGPGEFNVSEVIPGWTEALQKMRVGDKWQLFVPPQLGYGMRPPGRPIEANSLLVFDIELLEILK